MQLAQQQGPAHDQMLYAPQGPMQQWQPQAAQQPQQQPDMFAQMQMQMQLQGDAAAHAGGAEAPSGPGVRAASSRSVNQFGPTGVRDAE